MKVTLVSYGSLGDDIPLVALALGLSLNPPVDVVRVFVLVDPVWD